MSIVKVCKSTSKTVTVSDVVQSVSKRSDRIVLDTVIAPSVRQKATQRDFWDSLLDEGSIEGDDEDNLEARLQSLRHIKVARLLVSPRTILQIDSRCVFQSLHDCKDSNKRRSQSLQHHQLAVKRTLEGFISFWPSRCR